MNWYNNGGNSESFKTITSSGGASGGGTSEWKLLSNINADCLSAGKPLYSVSKCTGNFQSNLLNTNNHIFSDLCEERQFSIQGLSG